MAAMVVARRRGRPDVATSCRSVLSARPTGRTVGGMTTTEQTPTIPAEVARRAVRLGDEHGILTPQQVRGFVAEQLAATDVDGRSVCVVVPDATRTCPLPLLVGAVHEALHGRVSRL